MAFWQEETDIAFVVCGDDVPFSGVSLDLDWLDKSMQDWFEVKVRARPGPEERVDKDISIQGRVVKCRSWGIEYQADPRHTQIVLEHFGLDEKSKGLTTNGKLEDRDEDKEYLEGAEATEFKAAAARHNYLAQDCHGMKFAAKERDAEPH